QGSESTLASGRGGFGHLHGTGTIDEAVNLERALVDEVEQGPRPEAENENEDREGSERRELARVDLGELAAERLQVLVLAPFLAELAEEHPLERPEVVRGRDDDARCSEHREHAVAREGADERHRLTPEAREAGQAERRHEREADQGRVER